MTESTKLAKELWETAEQLRGQVEPSEYKYIVLGLLFLKDADIQFKEIKSQFMEQNGYEKDDLDKDYVKEKLRNTVNQEGCVYVPEESNWESIRNSDTEKLSKRIDKAMEDIENENKYLENALPDRFEQADIDSETLRKLLNRFSEIERIDDLNNDIVGNIYEYFIREFAKGSAQGDGEFYTPRDIVELIVDSIRPIKGRIFDPCSGTGGMFVQSYKYAQEKDEINENQLSFYGQEYNSSTAKLGRMNMLLHNLSDAQIRIGDSLSNDRFDMKFDKIITNPPFNYTWEDARKSVSDDDPRFKYGMPNGKNANYAFIQHMIHHTKKGGLVGTVMANGALANNSDKNIRKGLVEDDLVDAIITLPEELFYTVSIPVSIFIFSKGKGKYNDEHRDRKGETLFVDATDLYESVSRSENRLTDEHVERIAMTVRKYRGDIEGEVDGEDYKDVEEFCKVATSNEIADTNYNLNPGRYISFNTDTDHTPLDARLPELRGQLEAKFKQSRELESNIMDQLSKLEQNDNDESEGQSNEKQDTKQGDKE